MKNNILKKFLKKFIIASVVIMFFCGLVYGFNVKVNAASSNEKQVLSTLDDDTLYDLLQDYEVDIPDFGVNDEEVTSFIRYVINKVEEDPSYYMAVSYDVLSDFIDDITEFTKEYYSAQIETYNLVSTSSSPSLQDSLVFEDGEWVSIGGDWNPKWENYNCYAYSIKRTEEPEYYSTGKQYQPGDFSGQFSYEMGTNIGDLKSAIEVDLTSLGYEVIYNDTICPSEVGDNQELICVRTGYFIYNSRWTDYHFMRYDKNTDSWYHKPGPTAVLKYKYNPTSNVEWTNENSYEGNINDYSYIYDSEIYYILYNVPSIEVNCKSTQSTSVKTIDKGMDIIYKVNIECARSYKFTSIASSAINVTFYNNDMDIIPSIIPVMSNNNSTATTTTYLNPGTYYLRLNFVDSNYSGNITTKYQATYPIYDTYQVNVGETTLPTHLHIGENNKYNLQTYFINTNGSGFYKFTIEATKSDGSIVAYPLETLKIYDHMNEYQEDKYNVKGYSQDAETINGENYLYMYLERNGYFYIHISLLDGEFSSLKFIIERVSVDEIDVASRYDEEFTEPLITSNNMTEYATGFSIDQTSMFELSATTSDTYSGNITLVLFRKEYNSNTHTYYRTDILGDYLSITSEELILEEGTYYVGFFGNTSKVHVTVTIDRIVNTSEIIDQVLIMDPSYALPYGTEVRHNGGGLEGTTITEGFTRHVHFKNVTGVPSVERQDYNFYSSNTSYATVSEFGTVFAKSVSQDREVIITAVYKYNPAIIFTIDLEIKNDTSNTPKVIETTQTIYLSDFVDGKYKLVLDEHNSPYPWIQYFSWSVYVPCQKDDILVTMDYYGFLTTTGAGSATLTGEYTINPNVTIIIHINFVE